MWLVLCPSDDLAALWAFHGLKERGLESLELVTVETLGLGVRWDHRVSTQRVSLGFTLADGRCIRDGDLQGTLNRLSYPPLDSLVLFQPADREYVRQELTSFFLSWLSALPGPVINRPTPWGLAGQWRHVSEWAALAARAGLPVPPYHLTSRDLHEPTSPAMRLVPHGVAITTLIVAGSAVVGASAPPSIREGCLRLAGLADTALLGVEFLADPQAGWLFAGATPLPDLRLGGEPLLDALALLLRGKQGVQ